MADHIVRITFEVTKQERDSFQARARERGVTLKQYITYLAARDGVTVAAPRLAD